MAWVHGWLLPRLVRHLSLLLPLPVAAWPRLALCVPLLMLLTLLVLQHELPCELLVQVHLGRLCGLLCARANTSNTLRWRGGRGDGADERTGAAVLVCAVVT